jgi:hypothetical protein
MFQVGFLKALYDDGRLDEIDIISAVSGGSYTAHWVFANEAHAKPQSPRFGHSILDDSVFIENSCNLFSSGNFVGYPRLVWHAVSLQKSPKEYYEDQIVNTFGYRGDKANLTSLLPELKSIVKSGGPYLILNGTIMDIDDEEKGLNKVLFEMTPLHRGNDYMGYMEWGDDKGMPLSQASAISGAAIKKLLNHSVNISPAIDIGEGAEQKNPYGSEIRVSDGGHSENLGAVALIKRGIPNIIVADAEMDAGPSSVKDAFASVEKDSELVYEGLYKLIRNLVDAGYTVEDENGVEYAVLDDHKEASKRTLSPKLTSHDPQESRVGFRTFNVSRNSSSRTSTVYYVKMRLNDAQKKVIDYKEFPSMEFEYRKKTAHGWHLTQRLLNDLEKDNSKHWNCKKARGFYSNYGGSVPHEQWLEGVMLGYANFLNINPSKQVSITKDALATIGVQYKFPHTTTADQSFYIDQTMAYVGLGYLQAKQLVERLRSD